MAARARGGGVRGGWGGHRRPRDGGGRGIRSGGRNRDGRGETYSKAGAAWRKTAATASGRRNATGGTQVSSDRAGGKYRADGTDREESADESAK